MLCLWFFGGFVVLDEGGELFFYGGNEVFPMFFVSEDVDGGVPRALFVVMPPPV